MAAPSTSWMRLDYALHRARAASTRTETQETAHRSTLEDWLDREHPNTTVTNAEFLDIYCNQGSSVVFKTISADQALPTARCRTMIEAGRNTPSLLLRPRRPKCISTFRDHGSRGAGRVSRAKRTRSPCSRASQRRRLVRATSRKSPQSPSRMNSSPCTLGSRLMAVTPWSRL